MVLQPVFEGGEGGPKPVALEGPQQQGPGGLELFFPLVDAEHQVPGEAVLIIEEGLVVAVELVQRGKTAGGRGFLPGQFLLEGLGQVGSSVDQQGIAGQGGAEQQHAAGDQGQAGGDPGGFQGAVDQGAAAAFAGALGIGENHVLEQLLDEIAFRLAAGAAGVLIDIAEGLAQAAEDALDRGPFLGGAGEVDAAEARGLAVGVFLYQHVDEFHQFFGRGLELGGEIENLLFGFKPPLHGELAQA